MRGLRWVGMVLLVVGLLSVLAAWYSVWSEHQREVERLRFVWGADAKVPSFNPLNVVNPVGMSLQTWSFYILALMVGVPGLVCLALSRRRQSGRG